MQRMRQTGRTTRMIEQAVCAARHGRAVYIVAASSSEAHRLAQLTYEKMTEGEKESLLGIKFETPSSLCIDWRTMELPRGASSNCLVLFDHFAIESEYAHMLEELHRYDSDSETRDLWCFKVRRAMWLIAAKLDESASLPDPYMTAEEMKSLAKEIRTLAP